MKGSPIRIGTRGSALALAQARLVAEAFEGDPAWRRLPDTVRQDDGRLFMEADAAAGLDGVRSVAYSSVGLEPGVDLLFWRMAPNVDALETAAAALLRSGLGRWLSISHSFIGRIGPSQCSWLPHDGRDPH